LIPLVYNELRHLAARRLARERAPQTLQATALVHEAYLRLLAPAEQTWPNRRHFFMAAAEAMRRIMIESARRKRAIKRGGDLDRSDIDVDRIPFSPTSVDVLDLNEALQNLEKVDAGAAELVRLRYFAGLTMKQIAEILGVSRRTAENNWIFARTWIYHALTAEE
jgi:RNA polymerase sigma factor (TIGR02999 family)